MKDSENYPIKEEQYEADDLWPCAKKSRIAQKMKKQKPLLHDQNVLVINDENMKPASDIVEQLVVTCGGNLVESYSECNFAFAHDDYKQKNAKSLLNNEIKSFSKPIVKVKWLLDSLSRYKILTFDHYLLINLLSNSSKLKRTASDMSATY